jgi:hypothetical protein
MSTKVVKFLIINIISIIFAQIFGWVTKTEALLGLIFVILVYVLRVLCEILESIKNFRNKIEKEKEQ